MPRSAADWFRKKDEQAARAAARHPAAVQKYKARHRSSTYGMTEEEYNSLLTDQEGSCAICKFTPDYDLHVDHDHVTGKVRGLLCAGCNTGLGAFGDTAEGLQLALNYLMASK